MASLLEIAVGVPLLMLIYLVLHVASTGWSSISSNLGFNLLLILSLENRTGRWYARGIAWLILLFSYYPAYPTTCIPLPTSYCLALPRPFPYLKPYERYEDPRYLNFSIPIYKSKPLAAPQPCNFDASILLQSTIHLLETYNTTCLLSSTSKTPDFQTPYYLWKSYPFSRHLNFTSVLPVLEDQIRAEAQPLIFSDNDDNTEDRYYLLLRNAIRKLKFMSSRTPAEEKHLLTFRAIFNYTFELNWKLAQLQTRLRDAGIGIQKAAANLTTLATAYKERDSSWIWQRDVKESRRLVSMYAELLSDLYAEISSIKDYGDGLFPLVSKLSRMVENEEKDLQELYLGTTIPGDNKDEDEETCPWESLTDAGKANSYLFQNRSLTSSSPSTSSTLAPKQKGYIRTVYSYLLALFARFQPTPTPGPGPGPANQTISAWDPVSLAQFDMIHSLVGSLNTTQRYWEPLMQDVKDLWMEVKTLDKWGCFGA